MASDGGPSSAQLHLKTPKGTRDWVGRGLLRRDLILQTASKVFERHGGVPLDTPVFELREILTEKYGEDSKLIYNLEDQGGEACSLRYDLTVPFARWLATRTDVKKIKRYQIAKVYRRDQPAIARGRLREFYQCDFDIAGMYDPMIPDAEILRIITEVFEALEISVTIKLNHRKILDGMFAAVGVPGDQTRAVSSAVDKLDKSPWAEVKKEMVEEKGVAEEVADRIGVFVRRSGSMVGMIEAIQSDAQLSANSSVKEGLDDMTLLLSYLEAMNVVKVSFDLSLARGLDYYTGLIYEVIPESTSPNLPSGMGSIAAGGRYDGLVGMFGKHKIPCVGISFGVDRILTILEARRTKSNGPSDMSPELDAYVVSLSGSSASGLVTERMKVARELWDGGIRAGFTAKVKAIPIAQFEASKHVPVAVIFGEDELASGQVRLKLKDASKDRGRLVPRANMVEEVRKLLRAAEPHDKPPSREIEPGRGAQDSILAERLAGVARND